MPPSSAGGLRVAVLSGGRSSEHDISLASARAVSAGLREAGFEPVEIEIARDGRWRLAAASHRGLAGGAGDAQPVPLPTTAARPALLSGVDVAFPVLHGPFGEDGTVQGLLELADIPYVGPGVAASAVAMDKDLFKAVMRANDVPVARSITLRAHAPGLAGSPFGYPVVVKPARLGSSVGISIVRSDAELGPALGLALRHDDKVLVEEYVRGVEIECSVLGNEEPVASAVGQIVPKLADWYDFASKYEEGGMELVVPARIPGDRAERARDLAVRSFRACNAEGMARVDMFLREDGEVLVNELNTIPGFTSTSVYARLLDASGVSYVELLRRLVGLALERHERRARLRY
ncbi:MAG: D-alanine--D-alanine ligase [Thermoleophilia bacterium]|nr:D-alanine--D-alanine ligase [Thermoleophilia bacterium]